MPVESRYCNGYTFKYVGGKWYNPSVGVFPSWAWVLKHLDQKDMEERRYDRNIYSKAVR